jgi:hypothetical protein
LCEEAGIRIEKQANLKTNRLNKFYGKNLLNSYFNEVGLFLVSKIKN